MPLPDAEEGVQGNQQQPQRTPPGVIGILLLAALAILLALPLAGPVGAGAADLTGWAWRSDPVSGRITSGVGRLALDAGSVATGRDASAMDRSLQRAGARFIATHAELLGARSGQFVLEDARASGRLVHLHYRQRQDGIPIWGAYVRLVCDRSGHLVHFAATPNSLSALAADRPELTFEAIREAALTGLTGRGQVTWYAAEQLILPTGSFGLDTTHLAWHLRFRTASADGAWRALVDAHTGEIIERQSLRYEMEPHLRTWRPREVWSGSVQGALPHPTPWDPLLLCPYPDLEISVWDGSTRVALGYSDDSGAFELSAALATDAQLRARLVGRYARIDEGQLGNGCDSLIVTAPLSPLLLDWTTSGASLDARAAYCHVTAAHAALVAIDPAFPRGAVAGVPHLERPLAVVVNDTQGRCNAYALLIPEAPEMHFFMANDSCASTAQMFDVALHEYAHLVTMYAYLPEWAPADLHEGFSDYFAATVRDTGLIGDGFWGPGTYLRTTDHDFTPAMLEPYCGDDPHCAGMLLAGALWDVRRNLIAQLADRQAATSLADSLFHFARYAKPRDPQEMMVAMLLLDDDDGDLTNGSPHLEAIADGFARHEIADFSVQIHHAPLADLEDTLAAPEVTARIWSIYPPDPNSVRLYYSVDGQPYLEEMMTPSGACYAARIPARPAGSTVRYYLIAADREGHAAVLPTGAPCETYRYFVGPDRASPAITHMRPTALTAGQPRLWLAAGVSDNAGDPDSVWVAYALEQVDLSCRDTLALALRIPAVADSSGSGQGAAGLYAATIPFGEGCASVLALGDRLLYDLSAIDRAGSPNQARLPSTHRFELPVLRGQTWDLEDDLGGIEPTGDWEWGAPCGAGPPPATSGQQLLGTRLTGYYDTERISHLTLGPFDLSGWAVATLEFAHWYRTEEGYDGGRLLASRDEGASWEILSPLGGYPDRIDFDEDGDGIYESNSPAFAGDGGNWDRVRVPLDVYAGDTLWVRFEMISDQSATDLGWYLDDLQLLEQRTLAPPSALTASSGGDGLVTLRWIPPAGLADDPDFSGYALYRGPASGDYRPLARAQLPGNLTEWTDEAVENGTRYYYALASRVGGDSVAASESELGNEAVGYPYRVRLVPPAAIDRTLYDTRTATDTLWLANTGTGVPAIEIYHADAGTRWDEVRVICDVLRVTGGGFRELRADPPDASAPDLRYLACRRIGQNLVFRIGVHDSFPDPQTDFSLRLFLDTDLSLRSGVPETNIGADYTVLLGREPFARWGELGLILDSAEQIVDRPSLLILRRGLDSLEVGVPLQTIGWPELLACAVRVDQVSAEDIADRIPDSPRSSWLSLPVCQEALPEAPYPLPLAYDLRDIPGDEFGAQLYLTTNDPDQPLLALPVNLHLTGAGRISAFGFDAPRPTPFRGRVDLRLHLPSEQTWSLRVCDLNGRLVRTLWQGRTTPGIRIVAWDGRDLRGNRAPQGVYFAVAQLGGQQIIQRLVHVR